MPHHGEGDDEVQEPDCGEGRGCGAEDFPVEPDGKDQE